MEQLASIFLHSRTQTHIFHLGVKGTGSYALHKALNEYYDGILGLMDGLLESYQGKYGIIKDIKVPGNINNIKTDEDIIKYFDLLSKYVESKTKSLPKDTYLMNTCDEIASLIYQTTYLLKNLD